MINKALIMSFIQCMVAEDYYRANDRLDRIITEKVKSKIKKAVKKVVGGKKTTKVPYDKQTSKVPTWAIHTLLGSAADDNEPAGKTKKKLPAFMKKSKGSKK